jgi:hypothetical protein
MGDNRLMDDTRRKPDFQKRIDIVKELFSYPPVENAEHWWAESREGFLSSDQLKGNVLIAKMPNLEPS